MRRKYFSRRAFTLVEILTVIAIIGILASIIVGLRPGNPRGLEEGRRLAASEFRVAQSRAVLGANPDRNPDLVSRYNIRSGVLVLDDENDPDRHLRFLQPIVGGTASADSSKISDYFWYAAGEGVTLPQGVFFVSPEATGVETRSVALPLEGSSRVKIDPDNRSRGQKFGSGKKQWYLYLYDSNGQTYMAKAVFFLAEGVMNAGTGKVDFGEDPVVSGFVIHRSGALSFTRDDDEAKAAAELGN